MSAGPIPPTVALGNAVTVFVSANGERAVHDFQNSSLLILSWIDYCERELSKGVCDSLLASCRASQIEAASCLALGLARPALFAMRLQFELFLAWIYFNDHPVEWLSTSRGELDFPMRRQNISYLEKHNTRYKARFTLLANNSRRIDKEPYRTLSSFVHGSNPMTMPQNNTLDSVVQSVATLDACNAFQKDVSEYLSDVAACWLTNRWRDFPRPIMEDIRARLTAPRLRDFCSA